MPLDRYHEKRDFGATSEPSGDDASAKAGPSGGAPRIFVVQKHAARSLHYDFRLEVAGLLASWAVPKGPSMDPNDKRLAVHVEDHPLEYASFEGVIPEGQYGAGTVEIWDSGTFEPLGDFESQLAARQAVKFILHGDRLRGGFALVPLKPRGNERGDNWLLIKERNEPRPEPQSQPQPEPLPKIPFQLATLAAEAPSGPGWIHEVKYDGYRLRAVKEGPTVRLLTRNGLDWTARFGPLAAALARLAPQTLMLDGEAVIFDERGVSSFGALQRALKAKDDSQVTYVAFDLLFLDGVDLRDRPLIERKELLRTLLSAAESPRAIFAEHVEGSGPQFYRQACAHSLEGIISKRADSPWVSGRSRDWLKVKCGIRETFTVVGFTEPAGSRAGFGALLLAEREQEDSADGPLRYVGKVGTGFSDVELLDLRKRLDALATDASPLARPPQMSATTHWVRPQLQVDVRFAEWTSTGHLRHPSFIAVRKRPTGRITNPGKIIWPGEDAATASITKADLIDYYARVASHMLPEIANRPLTLVRCPHGVASACFYQKHPNPRGFPSSVGTVDIQDGDNLRTYMYVDSAEGLLDLVQLGVIEFHTWGSTLPDTENPDRMVLDLDPGPDVSWGQVRDSALELRDMLAAAELPSFPKSTGGRGLHVVVPLEPRLAFDAVRAIARGIAEMLESRAPERYTASAAKARRTGRIFVDYMRNAHGATSIATYSTRARPGMPVSVKLRWEELAEDLNPEAFTMSAVVERLANQTPNP